MKIRNEQLQHMQESEVQRGKTQKTAEGFDDLFSRHLEANSAQAAASGAAISSSLPGLTGPLSIQNPALLELQAALAPGSMQATGMGILQDTSNEMDSMLSTLENYTSQLASDGKADLRGAYSMLENVSGKINELKERYPDMAKEHPELASLVNELDVLTVTETYKFNRGDYL